MAEYKRQLLDENSMTGSRGFQGAYLNYADIREMIPTLGSTVAEASDAIAKKFDNLEMDGDERSIFPNFSDPNGCNKIITEIINWRVNIDIQAFNSEAPVIEFFNVDHIKKIKSVPSASNTPRGPKPKSTIK